MPCIDAMVDKVVSLDPDHTVEEAMKILESHHIRKAPVLDKDNILLGMFGFDSLLEEMLPVSVKMIEGLDRLDFVRGAKPDIARRLRVIKSQSLTSAMDDNPIILRPDLSVWEGIRKLAKHGSPLSVVEKGTGKFLGIVTEQSAIAELERDEYNS
ncbi:CBS domain-containing protein [Cohaesibacter sp. ES.047]|uniref:CBS domain-containing protein n=1 Tax=Cohaesibacter sp. ES.047 TaxID=1798205 RepID=UPI000BB81FE7|nr:CBS domain-containing protein [Cohaesibacter sp. ES.047]SNY90108.1 CBS domain-containing protein [Cohaesibacter sp. ES.047]